MADQPHRPTEIGLVLQGGGALGAYEWGAVTALLELMDKAEAHGRQLALKVVTGVASLLILILAGLAISSMAGAATALAMNLAPNPFAALEIAFWLLGSLEDRSLRHVTLAPPFILAGGALLFRQRMPSEC